ncbi:MAG TPA: cation diffusion facilitator family transporter [Candidatus Baltobacteraceae bacterium]|nr:cation diffusion facilitator family transporter [Candidatus Baltobacteraceae bacterium]
MSVVVPPSGAAAANVTTDKVRVARLSAIAACALVFGKLLVGWQTGSLAILSEAAHSTLDLVASVLTLLAVRVSDRPADREHHYGHGKIESLSALVETSLLVITCGWIVWEAVDRLFSRSTAIEPTWAAFGVIIASIAVDISRSRALARVATATGSQALEADALNFRTDVWSSCTVLVGLSAVAVGQAWGIAWLHLADPLAAVLVALIVLVVGVRLGRRAVDVLLDRAPLEVVERIRAAIASVPDARGPNWLRVRTAGPNLFVDAAVSLGRGTSLESAHDVVSEIEQRIREVAPDASTVIHAEPFRSANESMGAAVRLIVSRYAAGAHDTLIYDTGGKRNVDLHLELPGGTPLTEAHALTERIEADLRRDFPALGAIHIHIDPIRGVRRDGLETGADLEQLAGTLSALVSQIPGIRNCRNVTAKRLRGRLWIFCDCGMDPHLTVREAHELGLELGRRARRELSDIERVTVHAEPEAEG